MWTEVLGIVKFFGIVISHLILLVLCLGAISILLNYLAQRCHPVIQLIKNKGQDLFHVISGKGKSVLEILGPILRQCEQLIATFLLKFTTYLVLVAICFFPWLLFRLVTIGVSLQTLTPYILAVMIVGLIIAMAIWSIYSFRARKINLQYFIAALAGGILVIAPLLAILPIILTSD